MRGPYRKSHPGRRFWRKVDPFGPISEHVPDRGRCWLWLGARDPNGYGRFGVQRSTLLAHRFAYELFVGPIPEGATIDHLCFNPACVNPRHLDPCTGPENTRRAAAAGRMAERWNTNLTHCKHNHEFTPENTRIGGSRRERHCRTCDEATKAKRSEARRLARVAKYGYDPGPRARFSPAPIPAPA